MRAGVDWDRLCTLADVDLTSRLVRIGGIELTEDEAWEMSGRLRDLSMRLTQTRLRIAVVTEKAAAKKSRKYQTDGDFMAGFKPQEKDGVKR